MPLTAEEIADAAADHFAEDLLLAADVALAERMRHWTRDELCAYFESNGVDMPSSVVPSVAPPAAPSSPPPPTLPLPPPPPSQTPAAAKNPSAESRARRRASAILGHAALERILKADPRDLWTILDVPPCRRLTAGEVTHAFRRQSLLVHPDKNPTASERASEAFKRLQAAHGALKADPAQPPFRAGASPATSSMGRDDGGARPPSPPEWWEEAFFGRGAGKSWQAHAPGWSAGDDPFAGGQWTQMRDDEEAYISGLYESAYWGLRRPRRRTTTNYEPPPPCNR